MKQKQKIIKIGNSAGVILPQNIRESAGIKLGDSVSVGTNGNEITIAQEKRKQIKSVDDKFMKMVDEFINDHEDVLKELAGR